MTIYYRAENRKPLVQAVSEFTGEAAVYMRTPTYAYQIGGFTVTREGNLEAGDETEGQEIEGLMEFLTAKGFAAEEIPATASQNVDEEKSAEASAEPETEPQDGNVGLTVVLTREGFTDGALENLRRLVDSKAALMKKALAVEELPIEVTEEKVSFPWFSEADSDSATAYSHFIAALCDMAKNQKRITAKEKVAENEKYAFRCFLLRLGFIGAEYKTDRKILLKNLSGSSAFKNGEKKGADSDEISE